MHREISDRQIFLVPSLLREIAYTVAEPGRRLAQRHQAQGVVQDLSLKNCIHRSGETLLKLLGDARWNFLVGWLP